VTAAFVAGLLAGYGIALPVGAVATYLVALTARTSLRIGAAAALGVATADGLYALAAVIGGWTLVTVIKPVVGPLRVASGLVLLAVAVLGACRAVRGYRASTAGSAKAVAPVGPFRAYLSLLGITILNPTTIVYFAALVVGNRSATSIASAPNASLFVIAAFIASASWQLLLVGGGAVLGRLLTGVDDSSLRSPRARSSSDWPSACWCELTDIWLLQIENFFIRLLHTYTIHTWSSTFRDRWFAG
jgi:threonine/homoserine/homoserine lactone efflux protein